MNFLMLIYHKYLYENELILEDKNTRQKLNKKPVTKLKSNKNKASNPYDADDSDPEDVPSSYTQVSIQVIVLFLTYVLL